MDIPNVFQTVQQAIASYDYTDIDEGTGYIVFYGADTYDNGTRTYLLTKNAIYSDKILTYGNGTISTAEKILDIDFDTSTFNTPKDIKGKLRASVPLIAGHETTANKGGDCYTVVKVRKWDGTTETEIASNTKSSLVDQNGSLDTIQGVPLIEINISTVQHFKKGEQLRITVEVWGDNQASNKLQCGLLHDPKNRDDITNNSDDPGYYPGGFDSAEFITSVLEFHVPFVINL